MIVLGSSPAFWTESGVGMMRAHVHMHAGNTSKKVFKYYVDNSVRDGNRKEWQAEMNRQ